MGEGKEGINGQIEGSTGSNFLFVFGTSEKKRTEEERECKNELGSLFKQREWMFYVNFRLVKSG